ncbi:hypothetical protein [Terriglobus albidus]|uniref:hypothetical protein n=1 Tax=Terriglobus albidus TaxID=1592106 RepID=UPI0021E0A207|nr:hypothetical protein [Terriglobus albidus]
MDDVKNPDLLRVEQVVAAVMAGLELEFDIGCRLTFVMRDPRSIDAYLVVTRESDLDLVIDTLQRSKGQPSTYMNGKAVSNG